MSEALGLVERGVAARPPSRDRHAGRQDPDLDLGWPDVARPPVYVTSLYNYVELADQLRGRAGERQVKDARFGIATGELGNYNAALVHVFEGVR